MDNENTKPTITRNRKPGQAPLYTDFVNVTSGAFGFKVAFGNIVSTSKAHLEVDDSVTFGMSAEFAQMLYNILGKQITQYESSVGKIHQSSDVAMVELEEKVQGTADGDSE